MTELFLEVADRAVAAGWLILAVLLRDNIYQSEYVTSPFVLGLIRPKIYLPFSLGADTMGHVLAHEQAHIARRDHWWKPLGFALTAVYWFQPLMWVAYLLFCRDIELACDQRVVRTMDPLGRANYSQALLDCSTGRRPLGACPLAFGEAGVKIRVRAALHYKKPGFWVVLVAVLLCAGAAAAFLTNPVDAKEEPAQTADAFIADTLSSLTLGTDGTLSFTVPDPIPTLEDGAVRPFMTLSATFSDQAGSFSVQKLLDRAVDWQPGQTYSGMLDAQQGQLVGITFVVSLESEVEPGVYQQYAMDHLELTPPFPYDRPAGYTQPSVAVSARGQTTDLLYTFSDGQQARLSLALPAGLEVGGQLEEDTGLPGLALLRDGQQVGTVLLYGLGATDEPTLAEVDTAAHALPMQIFAEVALSNHAGYEDYHVVTHSGTGAAATARYVWQELGTTDAAATDPWSSMDCVLAYDWSVMPCFVQLTLQTGVLDAAGLTALAESLTLTAG